jgi:hypothetical protein
MRRFYLVVLTVLVLAALALNLFTLIQLSHARQLALSIAGRVSASLADLEGASIDYTFQLSQSLPVNMKIPFQDTMEVPVKMTIPISLTVPIHQKVQVPIKVAGLVEVTVDLPINMEIPVNIEVPVDMTVPIEIDRQFAISTTVPVSLTVPISIPLSETSLGPVLEQMRELVNEVQQGW